MKKNDNQGFTLVEMLLAMTVFIIVIVISASAFNTILTYSKKFSSIEESNIEGVVGLEMFRHDLEQAGFGLPYAFDADTTKPPIYIEATGTLPKLLNDAPSNVPRAIAFQKYSTSIDKDGNSYSGASGSWYLAVKGSTLSRDSSAQKWSYANYSSTTFGSKPPKLWSSGNFDSSDRVIAIRRTFVNTTYQNTLAYDVVNRDIYWTYNVNAGLTAEFSPRNANEIVYLYGLGQNNDSVGMPFNRADFFIARPSNSAKFPASCAPGTGILYKATVNQSDGKMNYLPLLDCVADMQVVLGWDLWNTSVNAEGQDGTVDTWSNPVDGSGNITVNGLAPMATVISALGSPESLRKSLKIIKVYVLAQIGRKDLSFTSNPKINVFGKGELSLGREYNLTADMRNYRWKVYSIVAHPKNLLINQ